jgi:hypothetical protein
MYKQPFCSFNLAGVSLTDFGLKIPSPFCRLNLANSQIQSFTSWTLTVIVGGDASSKTNIAAFEALLYSAAQDANKYANSSGIPVSFMFGWLNSDGSINDNISYQGFTLNFNVATSGQFMTYTITGYASVGVKSSMPVLNIPPVSGVVQPSALVEGLAKAIHATDYYELDIDHNDNPTLINHGALTTSFNSYVRGTYSGEDDYDTFPGLLKMSKSYNATRDAAGLIPGSGKLSTLLNHVKSRPLKDYLKQSYTDTTPQCSSFSYWVDEPTMTQMGVIHYKSNAGLSAVHTGDTLEYGTANTNIISISGSYKGVAYNMTDLSFANLGFVVDGSGNSIIQDAKVVNSWSASLGDVFQTANIINDVNALASQFSGDFQIQIPGTTRQYALAQPVSLLIMSGNTISPVTGVYNIVSMSHDISNTFVTNLKLQRLVMSSANEVALSQGIRLANSADYNSYSYTRTSNIISPGLVDFGTLYPTYKDIMVS